MPGLFYSFLVMPAKAGIQYSLTHWCVLGPRLRGDDSIHLTVAIAFWHAAQTFDGVAGISI
jgi:hypothetical protein